MSVLGHFIQSITNIGYARTNVLFIIKTIL